MAKSKIITYDLRKAGRNYDELYKYLRSYNNLIAITESVWCVSTTKTCSEIRNELCAITDSNDGIFVAELTGTAAWHSIIGDSDLLKKTLQGN